mmetsp:Transcript_56050/g.67569  ORF Transcript_56050/g.67569 Transcript_56050/m.67569 type:complete len:107 (+) Transcript_56050:30-350(+)
MGPLPIFQWVLSIPDRLSKLAYLMLFLVLEILQQEPDLTDQLTVYADNQSQFKSLHKQSEAVKEDRPRSDLKAEIEQLEDERIQLNDKIEGLHPETKDKLWVHLFI